jgi:hypothetical protein
MVPIYKALLTNSIYQYSFYIKYYVQRVIMRSRNVSNLQMYTNISWHKPDKGLLKEAKTCTLENKRHTIIKAK